MILAHVLAAVESTEEGYQFLNTAVNRGIDTAFVGIVGGCAVAITFIVAVTLLILARGRRRERLALAAIQSNQGEVAKAITSSRPKVVLWIIGAIVAIVAIQTLPWGVTCFFAILVALYFLAYPHYKARNAANQWPNTPGAPTNTTQATPPTQGQSETANRTGGTGAVV